MPTLDVLPNRLGPAVTREIDGGRLLDACDELRAPILFSCRSASCGTCRVDVLEGADLLSPATPDELETLAIFGSPEGRRLACQVQVRPMAGRLRLAWVDD